MSGGAAPGADAPNCLTGASGTARKTASNGSWPRSASFGIYVHWPFCAAKCPYCDFNSHVRAAIDEAGWLEAVLRELEWTAASQGAGGPTVETIFFGGGTPSLMAGASLAQILARIAQLWTLAPDVEITLEANPASAEAARFADYRAAGVNRLSLGVQALNDVDLKRLGRVHNAGEAKAALNLAMRIFDRVSLDLIYARPDQDQAAWRKELKEALSFGTEHLSLYQLSIEPQTPFALLHQKGALVLPDEGLAADLYEITQDLSEAAGRPAYEISNHARPGAQSRHNLLYWRYQDYAGVGPGAHGRLKLGETRIATSTMRLPEAWREKVMKNGNGLAEATPVSDADAAREHFLMNLRLSEGVNLASYQARWGTRPHTAKLSPLLDQGLLKQEGEVIRATPAGRLVLNAMIAQILN